MSESSHVVFKGVRCVANRKALGMITGWQIVSRKDVIFLSFNCKTGAESSGENILSRLD